jgi:hypothetical protein
MTTYQINLNNNYPNQEFDLNIDEIEFTLNVLLQTTVQGVLLMTISINDSVVGQPFICLPNAPVIPYQYLIDKVGGNFVFETEHNNYPSYENFNNTCILYFITNDTIAETLNG